MTQTPLSFGEDDSPFPDATGYKTVHQPYYTTEDKVVFVFGEIGVLCERCTNIKHDVYWRVYIGVVYQNLVDEQTGRMIISWGKEHATGVDFFVFPDNKLVIERFISIIALSIDRKINISLFERQFEYYYCDDLANYTRACKIVAMKRY